MKINFHFYLKAALLPATKAEVADILTCAEYRTH